MDATFSPLPMPVALGGRGDSFTFMADDFDLDMQNHLSPNGSATNPSTPVGGVVQQLQESSNVAKSYGRGRRNSFDWISQQGGRQRSLSFEFFNMQPDVDRMEAQGHGMIYSGQPNGVLSASGLMSPEDSLLINQTPRGLSAKRKHLPFSSHLVSSGGIPGSAGSHLSTMTSFSAIGSDYRYSGYELGDDGLNSDDEFGAGALLVSNNSNNISSKKSSGTKRKRKPKEKKVRAPKPKKPKKPKKPRPPRKSRTKKKKNGSSEKEYDPNVPRIGAYTLEERKAKIAAWIEKSKRRVWDKKIKYGCRKRLADARPRYKGRFVKSLPEEKLSIAKLDADPALRAAMEATRKWKERQLALATKGNADSKKDTKSSTQEKAVTPPQANSPQHGPQASGLIQDSSVTTPNSPVTVKIMQAKGARASSSLSKGSSSVAVAVAVEATAQ